MANFGYYGQIPVNKEDQASYAQGQLSFGGAVSDGLLLYSASSLAGDMASRAMSSSPKSALPNIGGAEAGYLLNVGSNAAAGAVNRSADLISNLDETTGCFDALGSFLSSCGDLFISFGEGIVWFFSGLVEIMGAFA